MTSVDFNGQDICEPILGATVLLRPVEGGLMASMNLRPIFFHGLKSKSPQVLKSFRCKIILSVNALIKRTET